MFLIILLGLTFFGFLYIANILTSNRGVVERFGIPYVKPFLIFGSPPFLFHQFVVSEYFLNQYKKLGRTWGYYDGQTPTIVTADPEFIKQVTVKQFDNFTDGIPLPPGIPDNQKTLDLASGDEWRALRKILSPTFTIGKLKGMLEPMDTLADRTIEYLAKESKNKEKIDVKPFISGFSLDTICKTAFGLDTSCYKGENNEFTKLCQSAVDEFEIGSFIDSFFVNLIAHFPNLLKYIPFWPKSALKIGQITHDLIEERMKKNVEMSDFIGRLKEHKANLVPPVTSEMLDAQGMIFLLAGYEPTANTLQSAVYLLSKNPEVQDQLYEEVINICESSNKINHETIKDMHLLEATIKETLRLRPPFTRHDRVCINDCEVNGIKIPKNTRIQMPIVPSHLDEEFFPEPKSFKPERFLKENANQIMDFTWRPFGSGNRVCIGQRFAMVEIKIFLAKFVSKFKVINVKETKSEFKKGDLFLNICKDVTVSLEIRNKD